MLSSRHPRAIVGDAPKAAAPILTQRQSVARHTTRRYISQDERQVSRCRVANLDKPTQKVIETAKAPGVEAPPRDVEEFQWTKNWYPMQFSANLPFGTPQACSLLGQSLVLWRDKEGVAHCVLDSCPHRQVPLSEGRVEADGTLMCSYHGWRFNGAGQCVDVPQSVDASANRTACASQRSRALSFPCKEMQGKIWVFGTGGPTGFLESEMVAPALNPDLQDDPYKAADGSTIYYMQEQFHRILPYDYSILLQNLLDPSHIHFSHHNMIGDREHEHSGTVRTALGPPPRGAPHPLHSFTGEVESFDATSKGLHQWTIQWSAPSLARWGIPYAWAKDKSKSTLNLYLVPTRPQQSAILVEVMTCAEEIPWPLRIILKLTNPIWLTHINGAHKILDSDGVFLVGQDHYQGTQMAKNTWKGWRSSYYMPAPADRYVSQMLNWLHTKAGGGPTPRQEGQPAPPPVPKKEALLDRYHSHTCNCKYCSGALRGFERLQVAALAGAAACFLGLSAALGRALPLTSPTLLAYAAGSVALMTLWYKVKTFSKLFFFWDYSHSTNNGPAKLPGGQ